jgi:phosphoribosylglycinamide formyltransferase-1
MTKPASTTPLKLAVLISGTGRTLKNFIDSAAEGSLPVDIRLVLSNTSKAGGLKFAADADIPTKVIPRGNYSSDSAGDIAYGAAVFGACRDACVDYVAMAGFLKLVPVPNDFFGRVLNIHPALIPGFCGPGMYGSHVHQAVLDAGVRVTGCTVHFVDNQYDHGPIIWQQPVPVFGDDTAATLGDRVFEAEKEAYPHVLKLLAAGKIKLDGRRVNIDTRRGGEDGIKLRTYPMD